MAEKFSHGAPSSSSSSSSSRPGTSVPPAHTAVKKASGPAVETSVSSKKKKPAASSVSSSSAAKDAKISKAAPAPPSAAAAGSGKKRPLADAPPQAAQNKKPKLSSAAKNETKDLKASSSDPKKRPAPSSSREPPARPPSSSSSKDQAKSAGSATEAKSKGNSKKSKNVVGRSASEAGATNQRDESDVRNAAAPQSSHSRGPLDGDDNATQQLVGEGVERVGVRRSGHLPSQAELDKFRRIVVPLCDPFRAPRDELLRNAEGKFSDWLALLDLNFSLHLFGTGSKRRLLQSFVRRCLAGEDVIEVDCSAYFSAPGHSHSWPSLMLSLLRTVADNVLAHALGADGPGHAIAASGSQKLGAASEFGSSLPLHSRALRGGEGPGAGGGGGASSHGVQASSNQAYNNIISTLNDDHVPLMQKTLAVADALMVHYGHSAKQRSSAASTSASAFAESSELDNNGPGLHDTLDAPVALSIYNRPSRVYILMLEAEASLGASGKADAADGLAAGGGTGTASSAQSTRDRVRAGKAEAMACLAVLGKSRAVGLLLSSSCATGAVTSGMDSQTYSQFRWAHVHAPTYDLPAASEVNLQDFGGLSAATTAIDVVGLEGGAAAGLDDSTQQISLSHKLIIKSLTPKHIDILNLLVNNAIGNKPSGEGSSASSSTSRGAPMLWTALFRACTERLVVKGDPELRQLLGELLDHRIVGLAYDGPAQAKTVRLLLPAEAMRAYISGGSNSGGGTDAKSASAITA